MKKVILSVLGLALVAGCSSSYDYYKTNVRYHQDDRDCVYYYTEDGERFSGDIDSLRGIKKVVYMNTKCSDLYADDTFGYTERNDRKAVVPVFVSDKPANSKCGCNKCGKKQVLKNRYIIVPE